MPPGGRRAPEQGRLRHVHASGPDCGYAWRVQQAAGVSELSRPDFLAAINELLAIYAAAMGAEPG